MARVKWMEDAPKLNHRQHSFQHVLITYIIGSSATAIEEATVQHLESIELRRNTMPGTPMLKGSKESKARRVFCFIVFVSQSSEDFWKTASNSHTDLYFSCSH